jgi:RNA polymerase sigma-70 factor (ECF subfamily)
MMETRRRMPAEDFLPVLSDCVDSLYEFVSRRTGGDRALSEDVTQEACLRAVRQWRNGDAPRKPRAWLRTVARNLLADHHRRRKPVFPGPERLEKILAREEDRGPTSAALLGWAFARMRSSQVRLLEAFHLEGKDVRSIAEEQGLSERAVEGRLRRARRALRRRLAPRVGEERDHG